MTDTNSKAQVTDTISTTAILREWFGGDRYARDHEYLDAHFGGNAQRVFDWLKTAALAAQEKPEPGVAVKALIWNGAVADCAFGRYTVSDDTDDEWSFTFHCYPFGEPSGSYPDEIAAKTAAQADYEERIRSALVSTQAQAPAIPDGWKLVPVEPTADMVTDGRIVGWEFENCAHVSDYGDLFRRQWARALAIAPSPDLPEGEVETATSPHLEGWPRCLTLRDTKVYADEGQRIYTTATGHGYEKREYVLACVASSLREALHDLLTRPTDAAARQRARDAAIRSERSGE